MIVIRNASADDFAFVNELLMDLHNSHAENKEKHYQNIENFWSKEDYLNAIAAQETILLVAVQNLHVIGCCFGEIRFKTENKFMKARKELWLEGIIVTPTKRKLGIATKLLDSFRSLGIQNKCDSMELMVWKFNKAAITFYLDKLVQRAIIFSEELK